MDEADDEKPGERGETNAMRADAIMSASDAGPIGIALAAVTTGAIAVWDKLRRRAQ